MDRVATLIDIEHLAGGRGCMGASPSATLASERTKE